MYNVLRKKQFYEYLARSGSGAKERRMAILGFAGPVDFLKSALTDVEKQWLDACLQVKDTELMDRHRHNLPDWLVPPLKAQLGDDGFWQLASALEQPAGLDLRVNVLNAKREQVQQELAKAGLKSQPTPYSPWGLRIAGKPALNKLDALPERRHRGAGRGLATAGAAGGRQARRNGGGLLRRRRRQDAGLGRRHAQHRPAVRL